MRTTTYVRVKPLKRGKPMKGIKVTLKGRGINMTATVGETYANFQADQLRGKLIQVLIDGEPFGEQVTVPETTEDGLATLEVKTDRVHVRHGEPEEHRNRRHEEPDEDLDEEEESEGHLFIVTEDHHKDPIVNAVIRVSRKEAYLTDENGEATVPFFDDDTEVQISAPGFKTEKHTIEPDDEVVKITLETEKGKTYRPRANNVVAWVIGALILVAVIYLGFSVPDGSITIDLPSAGQVAGGIHTATWLVIAGTVCALIAAVADRVWRQQRQDLIAAFFAFILFQLAGWNWLIGLAPQGLGQYGLQAIFMAVSVVLLYGFAIAGTPDFTTPGSFWLANVTIAVLTGTFGPISDWVGGGKLYTLTTLIKDWGPGIDPTFTILVIGATLFAIIHFVVDILGLLVKQEDPAEKFGSFGLTALVLVIYYLATGVGWLTPVPAILIAAAVGALISEAGKMAYGFFVPESDKAQTPVGKALLRTKWDGVALAISIVIAVALIVGYI